MEKQHLQGKRYISLLRCSSPGQADTSIDDQRRVVDAFAREYGLVRVGEIALEGVSGSVPGNRTDIEGLICRKNERDDFDILLVHDTSRFTRAGIQHSHRIESDLNAVGIEVVSVAGQIPDGEVGQLVKSVYSFADHHQAESIALAATRGGMSSLLDDKSPYSRRPSYGIDRLYISPDGKPLHIIRNLPDRTQVMLHPDTEKVLARFDVNERSGVPNHYIKQKQDRIALVPGDEQHVEVVRRIYRRHYLDGWGAWRIVKELNTEGIPSPTGKKWNQYTVRQILLDPIYLGKGIANRYSSAIYYMRAPDRPRKSAVEQRELYSRKRPARRTRPRSEWYVQEQPTLKDFLPPEVRELATERQEAHLDGQASGHKPKPNRDRHRDSSFFLKRLLRSKQGDQPMTGAKLGKPNCKKRYYRVNRAYSAPDDNKVMRKMVPAEPLEQIVLETVKATLLALPDLRERIERQVRSILGSLAKDNQQLADLEAERNTIQRKLEFVIDNFDENMQEATKDKVAELKGQWKSVNERITRCESVRPTDEGTLQKIIDESVAAIQELGETLSDAPPESLRRYLQLLIGKLVVDLKTRETILEIRLPETLDAEKIKVCLVEGFACKSFNETHPHNGPILAVYRLVWDKKSYEYRSETLKITPGGAVA